MTGRTHRVGGMLSALAGYTILEQKGMLIGNVNPLLQLVVMYPFAIYGSTVSDLDHNWQSAPSKDIVSYAINKVLHLTSSMAKAGAKGKFVSIFNAKHRSWQTHSDLFLLLMIILSNKFINSGGTDGNIIIFKLITTGLILGVISHLILDMLTPEGVWCIASTTLSRTTKMQSLPEKIHLVPKSSFFATDGLWEELVRVVMWVICIILFARIVYSICPYKISLFL